MSEQKHTSEPLSVREVLGRLHRVDRLLVEFQPQNEGDGRSRWTVGCFHLHYFTHSTGERWDVWIEHPDGNKFQIIKESFPPGYTRPGWAYTRHGAWDESLQNVLREITNACEKEDKRLRGVKEQMEAVETDKDAVTVAKFSKMFETKEGESNGSN